MLPPRLWRRGRQGHDESDSFHNSSELSNRRHALVIQEVSWISQKVSRWRSSRAFIVSLLACLDGRRLSSRCLFTSFSNCHFDDARMVLYSYFSYACHFNSLCFQPAGGQSLFSSCRTDEEWRGAAAAVGILKSDPQSVLDQCSHICEKHREKKELLFSFSSQTKMNPRLKLFFWKE